VDRLRVEETVAAQEGRDKHYSTLL
jgi:hypothetical protein